MPPRARKTAAPKPALEGDTPAEPEEAATPDVVADEAAPPSVEPEPVRTDTPPAPAAQAVSALLEPPTATYRWLSATGNGSSPCRLCAPAGPPAGAGSFGCSHGQWVRVADGAD